MASSTSTTSRPPMPYLPDQRPRRLTLYFTSQEPCYEGSAKSLFFTRLPSEVRQMILREAFGNQTLHVELDYTHPVLPHITATMRHGARYATHNTTGRSVLWPKFELKVDDMKPIKWTWWSSVCHRPTETRMIWHEYGYRPENEPWFDQCKYGHNNWCQNKPSIIPSACYIGVMGWLLSCRQAYVEAIDILYATNIFHLRDSELIMNLPRLLLPSKLSRITALELIWRVRPFHDRLPSELPLIDHGAFLNFVKQMPSTFPHLQQLYLSIQGSMAFSNVFPLTDSAIFSRLDNDIFKPIEKMIAEFKCLTACTIAIPSSRYKTLKERAMRENGEYEEFRFGQKERIWCPLHLEDRPEMHGYWIELGHRDMGPGRRDRDPLSFDVPSDIDPFHCLNAASCSSWQ